MIRNMKKYLMNLALVTAVLAAGSCEPSHINDNIPSPGVCIIRGGLQEAILFDTQTTRDYQIHTFCSGLSEASPEVEIKIDNEALEAFNKKNFTNCTALPENCYELDRTTARMQDRKAAFNLTFKVRELIALSKKADYSDLADYVVPLSLRCLTEGVSDPVSEESGCIFVKPVLSDVRFSILSCNSSNPDHGAELIKDGNVKTYWENASSNNHQGAMVPSYEIVMELPMICNVAGFRVHRYPGISKTQTESITIEVSEDNINFIKVVDVKYGTDNSNNIAGPIVHEFDPIMARYVRWSCNDANRRSPTGVKLASLAEFEIIVK